MIDTPDQNYNYQETEYDHEHYAEGEEVGTEYGAEENYDETQLPVQGGQSFMQKYGNIVIFGGIGIFVLIMGYVTFGPMLFPKPTNSANGVADASALLRQHAPQNTPTAQTTATTNATPPVIAMAPMPGPVGSPAAQPGSAAIGVSPAAPITNPGISPTANTPVIPAANPNDPWSQPANSNQASGNNALPATPSAVQPMAAAPAAPVIVAQPALPVPDTATKQKLADLQQKLDQSESARQEQNATLGELQNRLAAAEAKLANIAAQPAAAPVTATATPPAKPKMKQAKAAKSDANMIAAPETNAKAKTPQTWELRSASEGTAWVSRPADNQLYRVSVGDELPGVGRVTAIRQQGDSWMVVGTTGQIRQN